MGKIKVLAEVVVDKFVFFIKVRVSKLFQHSNDEIALNIFTFKSKLYFAQTCAESFFLAAGAGCCLF